ncbi:MAG: NAD(P)H-dependent oxidoreductase [Rhizomicrobium sp.]
MLLPEPARTARAFDPLAFARRIKPRPRIAVVNGHPDPRPERYCAALCRAYAAGAAEAGLETRLADLRPFADGASETDQAAQDAFAALDWANQITVVFPLWLDGPPEPLRRLFASWSRRARGEIAPRPRKAHCVVTMAMPAFAYRALSRRAGARLSLDGVPSPSLTFVGSVEAISAGQREAWLQTLRGYGGRAA